MQWTLASPRGTTEITVTHDDAGTLWYHARRHGVEVVARSRLGVDRHDASFDSGLVAEPELTLGDVDEHYTLRHGKGSAVHNRAQAATLSVRNPDGVRLEVDLCAYEDAIAFRYRFPDDGAAGAYTVTRELTTFTPAGSGRAWLQPTSPADGSGPAHENLYADGVPIGTSSPTRTWDLPATFEVAGSWLLVSEVDLDASYHGTRLDGAPRGRSYSVVGPDPGEGLGRGSSAASSTLPWTLPWRVIAMADTAAGLLESTVVTDLARPTTLIDTSWVRPGRVSWSWWSDTSSPKDLSVLRQFIDLAATMGWEYSLVDADWPVHTDDEMRGLVDYARKREVGLFLWYNSGGPNNEVQAEPRDLMHRPEVRRRELARIAAWGVVGIKVDFFHSDKQQGIELYEGIIKDAAQAKLMVNLHGSTIPRGWERTWPNLMTMEAVRGAEWYLFEPSFAEQAVWHNTVLPFTRNVIGPMDYTPVTFGDGITRRRTTTAHELALAVVYETGLLHFADSPDSYRRQHPSVLDVMRAVPAAWDETVGLAGEPGDFVVVARRHADTWWVAGINGRRSRPAFDVDLSRIAPLAGSWRIIADGATRDDVLVRETPTRGGSAPEVLQVPSMPPGGGFVARLLAPHEAGEAGPEEHHAV